MLRIRKAAELRRRLRSRLAGGCCEVVLVSPPFGLLRTPSPGLSQLKAVAKARGFAASVQYSNLRFAELVGVTLYEKLAGGAPTTTDLAGDWVFVKAAEDRVNEYVQEILLSRDRERRSGQKGDEGSLQSLVEEIQGVRSLAADFVVDEGTRLVSLSPLLIGFTTVFQQTRGGVALADIVRQKDSSVPIIFGGANCEEPMGAALLTAFECIDAVVSGEGEGDLEDLLDMAVGFSGDCDGSVAADSGRERIRDGFVDLGALPLPDFDDYFLEAGRLPSVRSVAPRLVYEASRGCWWGERMHCIFCGLNGQSMTFRSKSADRVLSDLRTLLERHGRLPIDFADNILDLTHLRRLMPAIANADLRVPIFVETKANLKRSDLEILYGAGVRRIQPGIESLCDSVLTLMKKGVRAIQNIYLLRVCSEIGIEPCWNWLWGFPGEPEDCYDAVVPLVRSIVHLEPPVSATAVRLDRYSPMFVRSSEFGLRAVEPYPAYEYIFPEMQAAALRSLAYYFTFEHADGRDVRGYTRRLEAAIADWQLRHAATSLVAIEMDDEVVLWDARATGNAHAAGGGASLYSLFGLKREVYKALEKPRAIADVIASYGNAAGRTCEELAENGLVAVIGGMGVALGVPFREGLLSVRLAQRMSADLAREAGI